MVLDDGVARHLPGGLGQRGIRQVHVPLLEVRPTQAVEESRVPGLELEGAADEPDRLLQTVAALGKHVPQIIQRRGVIWITLEQLAQ